MTQSPAVRGSLILLAVATLSIGIPAAFAPGTFYEDYPFFASWVRLLPPFNEHLVSDVGGLYLGFAAIFAWAAWRPTPQLVLPVCWGFLLSQVIHFLFHVDHLEGFSTFDATAQTIALGLLVLLPLVPIWQHRRDG